jgi:trk system potassium uptake protein TrkA
VVLLRIVIIGAGEVGSSIAASLAASHEVVVIDNDPARVDELTYDIDVLAIHGDGTNVEMLREAGVGEADLVIASTDDDHTNIVVSGTAKACSDLFTIARVKKPQYLETWESSQGAFGVDFMVCTDLLAAGTIVGVIGLPTAQDVDMFADGLVQMTEFVIPEDSPVANQTVSRADRFDSLTFAAIIREDGIVIPSGNTVIEGGDEVVVIGSPESAHAFSSAIAPEEERPRELVIAGGGEIGFQVAQLLEEQNFAPRLVERDEERARWLAENLPGTTVLQSDASDRAFLERENIGMADVFIATLENDQQNLLATLLAKRIGADRAVAVVDTAEFGDLFEEVGVDVAVSPRDATAEEITRFTRTQHAENVSMIDGNRAEVMEVEMTSESPLTNRSIREIAGDLPEGVVIGAITRDGTLITPRGDTVIEVHDHVVMFADMDAVEELNAMV